MIYVLFISFPLLVYIFNIYIYSLRFKFTLLKIMNTYKLKEYLLLYIAFLIKTPIYVFQI